MTPTQIAEKVSEILGCKYSHHDLHYADYGFDNKHSLLTAYQGMSPYTFSILEDGTIWIVTKPIMTLALKLLEIIPAEIMENNEQKEKLLESWGKLQEAEKWIKENKVITILKKNLSPFYKKQMKLKKIPVTG